MSDVDGDREGRPGNEKQDSEACQSNTETVEMIEQYPAEDDQQPAGKEHAHQLSLERHPPTTIPSVLRPSVDRPRTMIAAVSTSTWTGGTAFEAPSHLLETYITVE